MSKDINTWEISFLIINVFSNEVNVCVPVSESVCVCMCACACFEQILLITDILSYAEVAKVPEH